jgi:hypothetical protein
MRTLYITGGERRRFVLDSGRTQQRHRLTRSYATASPMDSGGD